jgi:hypothetical protein
MKKLIYFITLLVMVVSCQKNNPQPNYPPPIPPQPIVTDNTVIDTATNLIGETWVIDGYRVSGIGLPITMSDTLVFNTISSYTYNGNTASYSFYVTASAYSLTINNTPWGNLTGSIFEGNLTSGVILGLKFADITMGSGNGTDYYLWMHRL